MRLLVACTALTLAACAGPEGAIKFQASEVASAIAVVDERPDDEKQQTSYASCANQGEKWTGIPDSAFTPPKLQILKVRLSSALTYEVREVRVRHFQNCYQVNSQSGAAAFAGISYPLAIAIDSAYQRGQDLLKTYIDVVVDGRHLNAYDLRPYKHPTVWMHIHEQEETAAVIAQSTEAAMNAIIAKLQQRRAEKE